MMAQMSAPPPSPPARSWVPALIAGCLGSMLLGAAMFTPAFLPEASPAQAVAPALANPAGTLAGRIAVIAAVPIMVAAWLGIRRAMIAPGGPSRWLVLAAWSAPLLLVPPVFSNDPYLYADQAWIVQQGQNPYLVGLSAVPGPYAEQVDAFWRGSTAVYPALNLALIWLSAAVTGFHPYWGVIAMRLPALAGVALLGALLPALTRAAGANPRHAAWLGLLNPLVIIHLVGGAHNDALMIGLIALALWLGLGRHGLWLAPIALGLAVAVKQPAAFAGLGLAFLIGEQRRGDLGAAARDPQVRSRRADLVGMTVPLAVTAAISIGTFALVSAATFGFGWLTSLALPGSVLSPAPVNLLVQFGVPAIVASWLGRAALVLIIAAAVWRYAPRNPWRVLVISLFAVALTGAVLHGWYLAWGTCFLALARFGRWAERLAVGGLVMILVYLSMAEYLGWIVLAQIAIGIGAAVIIDQLAYGRLGTPLRRLVAQRVAGAPGPKGMPSR